MSEYFLDAAYAIALSAPADQHHERAVKVAREIKAQGARVITTRAVVLEIGNALAKARHRKVAVNLLLALEADPAVEIISISDDLYKEAFELYRRRPDKEWGLTDCISFVVMQERGVINALTTDEHFEQAGFVAVLKDE